MREVLFMDDAIMWGIGENELSRRVEQLSGELGKRGVEHKPTEVPVVLQSVCQGSAKHHNCRHDRAVTQHRARDAF